MLSSSHSAIVFREGREATVSSLSLGSVSACLDAGMEKRPRRTAWILERCGAYNRSMASSRASSTRWV